MATGCTGGQVIPVIVGFGCFAIDILQHRVEIGSQPTGGIVRYVGVEKIDSLFDEFDVLLTVSAAGSALKGLAITGDPRMSLLWTYLGSPSLTLPAELDENGLPLGIQLVGRKMEDQRLLGAAVEIEKILDFTAKPQLPQ